ALWYNALCMMEDLAQKLGDNKGRKRFSSMAALTKWSFNRLLWNDKGGYLYDVVNGGPPDASIRPNQIFAVSLPHTMLSPERTRAWVTFQKSSKEIHPIGRAAALPKPGVLPNYYARR